MMILFKKDKLYKTYMQTLLDFGSFIDFGKRSLKISLYFERMHILISIFIFKTIIF